MGIPPKRELMTKLIRRYFKRKGSLASQSEEAAVLKNSLYNCWDRFGVDHPKCLHLIPNLDRGWAMDMIATQKYKGQVRAFPALFDSMMIPPVDKMYAKGTSGTAHWLKNIPRKMPKY